MNDHIYIIAFTGDAKPIYVYADNEQMAMNVILEKKKEAEILGKMKAKDYMKKEKQVQQEYQIMLDNKRRKTK